MSIFVRKHKSTFLLAIILLGGLAYMNRSRLSGIWNCIKESTHEGFEVLAPVDPNAQRDDTMGTPVTVTSSDDTLVAYQPGVSTESWANTFAPLDQAEAAQSVAWVQAEQNQTQPELLPMNVSPENAALLSNQNFLQAGSIANGGIFTRPVFRNDSGSYLDFFRSQILPVQDANAMAGTQLPIGEPIIRTHAQL